MGGQETIIHRLVVRDPRYGGSGDYYTSIGGQRSKVWGVRRLLYIDWWSEIQGMMPILWVVRRLLYIDWWSEIQGMEGQETIIHRLVVRDPRYDAYFLFSFFGTILLG